MSKSLAVKYRPKVWSDVTEQEYVKVILQNQIDNNAIKNAYLFCGGAGTGKTRTIIARALHLISTGVQSSRIKILSFTKKSAQEIANRIKIEGAKMPEAKQVSGSTFHSWCMDLITRYGSAFGLEGYSCIDEEDRESAISIAIGNLYNKKKLEVEEKQMKQKKQRMQELVELLNKASRAYYQEATEIMSNFEYDALYDELVRLEEETGMVLSNSPTVSVGYESVDELPKERHETPMLSLGKTKDRDELANWLHDKEGLLSWKLDGLTVVLTYENGTLLKAVTRGNGEVGEVITNNAKVFKNLPHMRLQI